MKFNKSWVAAILVYLISEVVKRYHIQLPDGWETNAYNYALDGVQWLTFALVAWWNKYHPDKPIQTEQVLSTSPRTYAEMVPIMDEVHKNLNAMVTQIQSGKGSAVAQDAIDMYVRIKQLMDEKKVA